MDDGPGWRESPYIFRMAQKLTVSPVNDRMPLPIVMPLLTRSMPEKTAVITVIASGTSVKQAINKATNASPYRMGFFSMFTAI